VCITIAGDDLYIQANDINSKKKRFPPRCIKHNRKERDRQRKMLSWMKFVMPCNKLNNHHFQQPPIEKMALKGGGDKENWCQKRIKITRRRRSKRGDEDANYHFGWGDCWLWETLLESKDARTNKRRDTFF